MVAAIVLTHLCQGFLCTPAVRTSRAALVMADKYDTTSRWESFANYNHGDYDANALGEAYDLPFDRTGAPVATAAVATTPIDKFIQSILFKAELGELFPRANPTAANSVTWWAKLLGLEELAASFSERDDWLEGCLVDAGDDDTKRSACMA